MRIFTNGIIGSCFIFLFVACNNTEDADAQKEDNEQETLAAVENTPCPELSYSSIDWNAPTPLGQTPAEIFGMAAGTCSAPLILKTNNEQLSPAESETEVTVSLSIDESSVQLGTAQISDSADDDCTSTRITINGTAGVQTADGVFQDTSDITLSVNNFQSDMKFQLEVPFENIGGSLSFAPETDASTATKIVYDAIAPGVGCVGEAWFMETGTIDGITAFSGIGTIATWSDTGCANGGESIDVEETFGTDMIQQITDKWSNIRIEGKWDDGATDALLIDIQLQGTSGCKTPGKRNIVLPATVTYSTENGILSQKALSATEFSVIISEDGSLGGSELYINDNRSCDMGMELTGYGYGSCDTLTGIDVQLSITDTSDGFRFSDEGMMVFEYLVNGNTEQAANNSRYLSFE